jgi:hypothetical protein
MFSKLSKILACALVTVNLGCYSYQPSPARTVPAGTEARVQLAEPQDVSLSSVTVRDVVQVEGELLEWTSANEAVLFSKSLQTRSGIGQATQGELVRVPETNIQLFEAARPSTGKTVALVVVGAGTLAALIIAIGNSGTGGDQGNPGNDGGSTTGRIGIPLPIFGR